MCILNQPVWHKSVTNKKAPSLLQYPPPDDGAYLTDTSLPCCLASQQCTVLSCCIDLCFGSVYMYICIHVCSVCVFTYVYVYLHTYMFVYICICLFTYVCVYFTYVYMCIYTVTDEWDHELYSSLWILHCLPEKPCFILNQMSDAVFLMLILYCNYFVQ